jgi:UDP-3-O-[3-hydroxymyristoyl] glucosamine N-acyltransferase
MANGIYKITDDFEQMLAQYTGKEKISIHSFTTIGMNAAVVKDITESGTYVGVPAKKINK